MIQWYPGHMAKALREAAEKIRLVDVVMIVLDARVPKSSLNPEIIKLVHNKPTLIVLNKKDKADATQNVLWKKYYETQNYQTIMINAKDNSDIKKLLIKIKDLMVVKRSKEALKGLKPRPIKTMIIGIPNVGKSTIINGLVHKKVATVADKPGVTKSQQWIRINQDLELLDTPGILWPKFENQQIASNLAVIGTIKDEIVDVNQLGRYALQFYQKYYFKELINRYEISTNLTEEEIITYLAKKNHFYNENETIDFDRVALFILNDIRSGRLGRITLDRYQNE